MHKIAVKIEDFFREEVSQRQEDEINHFRHQFTPAVWLMLTTSPGM